MSRQMTLEEVFERQWIQQCLACVERIIPLLEPREYPEEQDLWDELLRAKALLEWQQRHPQGRSAWFIGRSPPEGEERLHYDLFDLQEYALRELPRVLRTCQGIDSSDEEAKEEGDDGEEYEEEESLSSSSTSSSSPSSPNTAPVKRKIMIECMA